MFPYFCFPTDTTKKGDSIKMFGFSFSKYFDGIYYYCRSSSNSQWYKMMPGVGYCSFIHLVIFFTIQQCLSGKKSVMVFLYTLQYKYVILFLLSGSVKGL